MRHKIMRLLFSWLPALACCAAFAPRARAAGEGTVVIGGADGPTVIFTAAASAAQTDLAKALTLAWQGMTGIFVVMILIAVLVWALSRFTSGGGKDKNNQ